LIVGIDLGITTGIAILDIKGKIVDLSSKKEAGRADLIKHIVKFGNPLIIASDVNPLPKGIEKLASSFGCYVFYPKVSMSNKEKEKMIEDYREKIKDSHQKDALAAALRAFRNYHAMFLKIEEVTKRFGREDIFEDVVRRVLKKKSESIVDATKEIIKKEKR
jgi:predicted RNase H-like nuclease (RuvC/YqgF family)